MVRLNCFADNPHDDTARDYGTGIDTTEVARQSPGSYSYSESQCDPFGPGILVGVHVVRGD